MQLSKKSMSLAEVLEGKGFRGRENHVRGTLEAAPGTEMEA